MSYYFAKKTKLSFDETVRKVTQELSNENFGVLTEIDVKATLKKKLDVDTRPYVILGACNPGFAQRALALENKIGTMLPCNVIVQETENGVEIAAVDPVASMAAVPNPDLEPIAREVRDLLRKILKRV